MALDSAQKSALAAWIQAGVSLSEAQKRLESEFGLRMTYMDVRFAVDDLNLELKSDGPVFAEPLTSKPTPSTPGKVRVTLDTVRRPNAMLSGSVIFSDGQSALWQVDQMGRLSIDPSLPGYDPSQKDLQDFQRELQRVVEQSGVF